MKKIVFIDEQLIKNSYNMKINVHCPQNEKKIRDIYSSKLDSKQQIYFTIVKKNNFYYLFYSDKPKENDNIWNQISFYSGYFSYFEKGIDPLNFKDKKILSKEPIISHNIAPFLDEDENIKLIGGLHLSKKMYDSRILDKEDNIFLEYKGDKIVNPKKIQNKIKCNGIYLSDFENDKCNIKYDLPIINGTNEGLIENRKDWVISEFDGRSLIVYFKKKYYIYVRCNYKSAEGSVGAGDFKRKTKVKGGGVRAIQYAVSNDLINWSEFKLININFDFDKDNIYFFGVQKYTDDILVSTFPYSNGKDGYIGVSFSYNGKDWTNIKKLINSKVSKSNIDRVIDFNIHQIIEYENKLLFYIHRKYIWWEDRGTPANISYMELPKDRLTSISSENGNFSIELENPTDSLALNYKIDENGYIKVQIENNDNYTFDKFDKLENTDSIYSELKWNGNTIAKQSDSNSKTKLLVNFRLKNSAIYCIYYNT